MTIHVIKGNGEKVLFNREKLKQTLGSSGADTEEQEKIAAHVESQIYNGIPTKKIYQMAFYLLKKDSHKTAGRYKLKNAIMEMGLTEIHISKIIWETGNLIAK